MPVLVTIAAVTYLFSGGSKEKAGFLAPSALREKLEELPEGSTRAEALGIADDLDSLADEYDESADDAMNKYAEDVKDWSSSVDELLGALEPSDRIRSKTIRELVRLRQRLVDALTPEEWDEVFG